MPMLYDLQDAVLFPAVITIRIVERVSIIVLNKVATLWMARVNEQLTIGSAPHT